MHDIGDHERVNDAFSGKVERRLIDWLVVHLPAWVSPDLCTIAALIGAVVAGTAYALSHLADGFLWLASAAIVVHWFGDSLDGSLARARNIGRPRYGFFVDHVSDAFSQAVIIGGLGLSPFIDLTVAAAALIGLQLLMILVFIRTSVLGEFRISFGKIGPTEGRIVLILLNTAMFCFGQSYVDIYHAVVLFFGGLAAAHFLFTGVRDLVTLRRSEVDRSPRS